MRRLLTLLLFLWFWSPALLAESRPNVVLVMADDLGYGDLGIHGNDRIKTPNLDRFARESVRFTRFYSSPVCSPTRASLMTGRYYYRTGVIHTSRGAAKMHGEEVTVAELLSQAGYRTGIFGKWHLGDNYPMRPQDQSFQEVLVHRSGGIGQPPDRPNSYFDPLLWRNGKAFSARGYCTDVFFDAALEFIEQNQAGPFFVYIPTNAPHTPLEVSAHYSQPYREAGLEETTAKVYGMVTNLDENFGRLLQGLERLKLRENTLLIFMSDNGPQQPRYTAGLRGRKSSTYEGGIRVPFFVRWPKQGRGARSIDRPAAHIDVLPTLLAACGVARPEGLQLDGVSLLPLLLGKMDPASWPDRTLFFQCHRGLNPKRYQNCAVVSQQYKMVGYPGTFSREDLETSSSEPVLELYDLETDPAEGNDLAASLPGVLARLRRLYDAWFDEVRETRNFTPGWIHLGSDAENPVRLCRYQDASYEKGIPQGWPVKIRRSGRYRVAVVEKVSESKGLIVVSWQSEEMRQSVGDPEQSAEFRLQAGQGVLDVWVERDGEKQREADVDVQWMNDKDTRE